MSEDINTVEKPIEWHIWGITYDCEEFFYDGKKVTALMYSIKVNKPSSHPYSDGIKIRLTKDHGFDILIDGRCKDYIVSPYKIYFLIETGYAMTEPVEVSYLELMKHSKYFIESGFECSPEAEWLLKDDEYVLSPS